MDAKRIVIADDHPGIRQGLRRILERTADLQVIGEAENGIEALELVNQLKPDLLLLDIKMPVLDGFEVARQLSEAGSAVRVLILTIYYDPQFIHTLAKYGVAGYLFKDEDPLRIGEIVRQVAQGESYWSANADLGFDRAAI